MVSRERERERGSFEIFYKDILFMKKRDGEGEVLVVALAALLNGKCLV